MSMDASIVVATYDRARSLDGTLRALASQAVPQSLRWEVIVVDNSSRDATAQVVAASAATAAVPVRYVFEPEQGLSHARNRGVRAALGDIVAFTDDDVLPATDWLAQIVTALDRWQAHGVGGRILPRWEAVPPRWLSENAHLLSRLSIMDFAQGQLLTLPLQRRPQVWGANMAFRREVFERIRHFDTRLGIVGDRLFRGEEVDLVNRALQGGLRIAYDPAPTVFHRIDAARMRRRYFRKVAFDDGQCTIRQLGATGGWFLVAPLWTYRAAAAEFGTWLRHALRGSPDAFDRELAWRSSLGRVCGFWAVRRGRR